MKLIKKVGHIRRPFQAQAIALARLCHFLADKFNTTGASVSADHFNSLDEYVLFLNAETISSDLDILTRAFNKTLAVLEAAISVVSDLRSFDTAKFDTHSSLQEFEAAEVLIKKGFESFSVSLVLFMMYVRSVEHLPHSSIGPRSSRIYLLRALRTRNVWRN